MNHPNIVKYIQTDVCPDKSGVDIILEYMPGGSLRSLLDNF
jgi:serine/threonine protein kinase